MFNAKEETKKNIEFIKKYFVDNKLKGAVVGISGGKDSAVVTALMTKALGKENVIGVTMPCESKENDRKDAQLVAKKYDIELINVDLTDTYYTFKKQFSNITKETTNADINIKPRLRMSTLYYVASIFSNIKKGTYIVAGTSNRSEAYVGYFTKGGDSVCDIKPLINLTVSEVIKIGEVLEVPEKVLYKAPSDGLSNKTDEEKLGVSYKDIEKYLNNEKLSQDTKERIEKLHKNSLHKFIIPEYKRCA